MADVIRWADAVDIDKAWIDAGKPSDGMRCVMYKTQTTMEVPNSDDTPFYEWRTFDQTGEYHPGFYHLSGPTLAEWQQQQEQRQASQDTRELSAWASGR